MQWIILLYSCMSLWKAEIHHQASRFTLNAEETWSYLIWEEGSFKVEQPLHLHHGGKKTRFEASKRYHDVFYQTFLLLSRISCFHHCSNTDAQDNRAQAIAAIQKYRLAGCSQTLTSSPSEVGLFLLRPFLQFYPAVTRDSELLQLTPHQQLQKIEEWNG